MCLLLIANPNVREWLELSAERDFHAWSQLSDGTSGDCARIATGLSDKQEDAVAEHTSHRSAWIQAYFRYTLGKRCDAAGEWDTSAATKALTRLTREWQKAFETIAEAWGRFLSLVWLRR